MMVTMRVFASIVVLLATSTVSAQGTPSAAEAELERAFRAEVARVDPKAAEAFDRGNGAREADKPDEAIAAYRDAIKLAPNVDHPHRRMCSVLAAENRIADAFIECSIALELRPDSAYDQLTLASVLAARNSAGDLERALAFAKEVSDAHPNDPTLLTGVCEIYHQAKNIVELGRCTDRLLVLDPDGLMSNYMGARSEAMRGLVDSARTHLERAKLAGLDADSYKQLATAITEIDTQLRGLTSTRSRSDSVPTTPLIAAAWMLGIWLGLMGILVAAGYLLSRLTLRALARGTGREHHLRTIYRIVLASCGVYFYLSIPILIATIVVAGGSVIYVSLAIGVVAVKLVLAAAILVIATLGAIGRSLFVRIRYGSLGHRLDLERHPRLRVLVDEVAGVVGTRGPDAIYLTPGTEIAVTERGGLWASLRGKRTERSLILGIGLFEGMTQLQLRSILAHEHGHYRNADTAGGGFALAVRRSLGMMIIQLARSGAANTINPVWWFLRAYHRTYAGVSQGASRLQEVLADRWAVQAYGTAAFVGASRHVISRSIEFDRRVRAIVDELAVTPPAGTAYQVVEISLPNLYQQELKPGAISADEVAATIEQEMARKPTTYDSHPSPQQRIAAAEALAVVRDPQPHDDASVWDLFDGREELERAMSSEVGASLARRSRS